MLSKFSVKKPLTIIVAVLAIILLGVVAFTKMPTDLLPSMDLPYVVVMTTYPGANPEKVELTVTKPIESTLSTVGGLDKISSISSENSSMVIFQFNYGVNMDTVIIDMNNKLDMVKSQFDDGVGSPILVKMNPDLLPIMVASVDMDGKTVLETSKLVEDDVIPTLERLNGVASVTGMGLIEERVEITLSQDKIDALNDRILGSLDESLLETQKQLEDARAELESQKEKLASEGSSQAQKLAEAEAQLSGGKDQLNNGLNQIALAKVQLDAQLKELQTQRTLVESAITAKNALPELEQGISGAEMAIQQIDLQIENAENQIPALKTQRDGLQAALNALPDTPENSAQRTQLQDEIEDLDGTIATLQKAVDDGEAQKAQYETTMTSLKEKKSQIESLLASQGDPSLETLQASLSQIDQGIASCEEALAALPGQEEALNGTLSDLGDKQQQLEAGKSTMNQVLTDASVQLALAEKELDEKTAEFETARDAAYKQVNLEGMITKATLSDILTGENFSMPAGYLKENGEQYTVKVGDPFGSVEEIENLELFHIDADDIGAVKLSDVADVAFADNTGEMYGKINGNDGILLTLQKQSTASTSEVSDLIRNAMADLEAEHPGMHLTALNDQGIYIDIVIDSVLNNLMLGGALAIVILFLFLRNLKPTLIVAFSIPISLMLAVVLMYFTGVTMNVISLAGLALGVGMLVDNSIVVIENIYRMRAEGVPVAKAAVKGASQVAGAIASSTLTTICVFLPIVFTEGISKELFADMGLTIAYSLLASLFIALTLVPSLSTLMMKKPDTVKHGLFNRFTAFYGRLLGHTLRHKAIALIAAALLLGASVYGALTMGTAFMPETDNSEISVSLETPKETTKADTWALSDEAVERIRRIPGVETVGAMQSGNDNAVSMYVLLADKRDMTSNEIARKITEATADMPCEVTASGSAMDISALAGSGIEIDIRGTDLDELQRIAKEIAALVAEVPGTENVNDGLEDTASETRVIVDKNKALEYGLTVAQVYQEVAKALSSETTAATLTLDTDEYPVIVADDPAGALTRDTLGEYKLTVTKDGEEMEIPLHEIAEITEAEGLSSIAHEDFSRYMSVTAAVDGDHNIGLVSRDIEKKLASYTVPDGYSVSIAGESETISSTLSDLIQMVLLAVVLIYLIMVAQFQSFLSPFIVLFTIPLAFTGGFLLLWICGFEVSAIAMLGLLVLAGVVVNNGIVFVDCANQLRASGMERREALIATGRMRMRPILMTALTTILGLITLAFGMGTGSDMLQPMAVVIIGGLTYATALTLFIVPALYDIFQKRPIRHADVDDL